jgi:CHAT domain-containing protein/Tfp pilus assembly protein PilF
MSFARAVENISRLIVETVLSDSAAAKAGLKPGDRIISYDGKPLPSPAAFDALQQNTFGKQNVLLEIRRRAESLIVTVPLGPLGIETRPELPPAATRLYKEGKLALAAQSTGDPWLYNRLGETLEKQHQWKQATDAHLSAWNLLQNGPDLAAKSRTLLALGTCSLNRSDFAAAAKWYEQARQVDLAAGNEMWVAAELQGLGVVAYDRGDLPTARDYFQRDLAIPQRLAPHSLDMASSLNWLAKVARTSGDLPSAEIYFNRALKIAERLAPTSIEVADSLNGLGIVEAIRGNALTAQGYLSRALAIREQLEPISLDVAGSLGNLSLVAMTRGDDKAAQNYLIRALKINEEVAPDSLSVATTLINLGQSARNLGDLEAAEKYQKRALAIEERLAPNSLELADSLRNLGDVSIQHQNLAAAEDYENRALAIEERLAPNSLDATDSLHSLCHIALERDDRPAAQKICQRALQSYEQFAPDSVQVAGVLHKLGSLAMRERRFAEARAYFTRAVTVLESQRGRIPSADARALLVAEYQPEYEGLLQSLLALNDIPAAFSASEQARARSLLDLLSEAKVDARQGVDPVLLEREQQLQQSLNAKAQSQTKLLSGKHSEQEAALAAREMDAVTNEFHEVEAAIRTASPRYAALTKPQPLTVEELQRQVLDKDSLLLEYSLGQDASVLFAVSQDSIKSYPLPKRTEIEAVARETYEALTARNRHIPNETTPHRNARILQAEANYPKLAARLSQLILAPAISELAAKRLLIVADGDLLQIPFAALADPASKNAQPLIVNHEIVSLPSASVIALQRRELANRKPAPKQLALFADPVFEQQDERLTAMAALKDARAKPQPAARDISFDRAISEAGIGDDRSKLRRLPFSREEANAIFTFAPPAESLKALDFDANKTTALSGELGQYRIVHFASHALLNNDHPELSGIVLSLVDRQGQSIDGFLRLNEIYNLNLPADLVVLSACETGLGKQIQGEGLIGLTRGFMYAGAQRVVSSLWKVDDEATAELMGRFYERMLKEGEAVPAALRHAQLEMSKEERWRGAYFWAGFQMAGEWK